MSYTLPAMHGRKARAPERVAILGTGLMGGSVAAALRERMPDVQRVGYGVEPDISRAMSLGLFDVQAHSVAEALAGTDLVILAAPIWVNCLLFPEVLAHLGPKALLTDLSSVKAPVVAAFRQAAAALPEDERAALLPRYVPSHPIAGSERAGPEAAKAALFDGRSLILCATDETAPAAHLRMYQFWTALGSRVQMMSVEAHDRVFALVSHWPHAVAFAVAAVVGEDQGDPPAGEHAGPGLLDLTRIAGSSPRLWADILMQNRAESLKAAEAVRHRLAAIEQALHDGDQPALVSLFAAGANWRRRV